MKERINKWWLHLFWKYTATNKKIVELEALRYCNYITNSYDENQQIFILKELYKELINHREEQIKNKGVQILQEQQNLETLETNLNKIKLVYREP
jgi:hypothetical protein